MKKADIQITESYYECGDGCCRDYETEVSVNDEHVAVDTRDLLVDLLSKLMGITLEELMDTESERFFAEEAILKRLGYDVSITETNTVDIDREYYRNMYE